MPKKSRYPKEERVKRVFTRSKSYDPIPPTKKRRKYRNKKQKKYTEYTRTTKVENIVSPRVYKHYKLNRKNKSIKDYHKWTAKVYKLLKVLGKHIVDNEAGVFIKDFGYFYVMRHNKLTHRVKHGKIHGEGKRYSAMFAPIRKDTLLDTWCMDYGFVPAINSNVYNNIENNVRYKMAYTLLYTFYGNKQSNIYLVEKQNNGNNA